MAYKNRKTNKRHIKAKRIKDGNIRAKYKREHDRKHKDDKPLSLEEMEELVKRI